MTRLISGLVMAAAVVAAIWWLPTAALRLLALAVAVVALVEFAGIAGALGARVPLAIGITATAVFFAVASVADATWLDAPACIALVTVVLGAVALGASGAKTTLGDFGAMVGGALYIGLPLGQLVALHASVGRLVVLLLLAAVVVSDSSQYYAGRLFGRRLLAPAVSPKKTVEGAIGGFCGGIVLMATLGRWVLPAYPAWLLGALGAALVAVGIVGDLFESKLKRAAGVKDSSTLIPGHGGVLDRIDALLFVTPVFTAFLALTAGRF